jgi:flagellin
MVSIGSKNASSFLKRILDSALNKQEKITKELSSGKKSFMSDTAGGAIAATLDNEVNVRKVAERNAYDGAAIANLRDSALSQVENLQARNAELAAQSANGTYSDEQRELLDKEFQANSAEIDRIVNTTEFNGKKLFEGQSIDIQVGSNSSADSQISLKGVKANDIFASKSIATMQSAKSALDTIKTESTALSSLRAEDGAASRRLEMSIQNNQTASENFTAAASRITDIDVAQKMAEKTTADIRQNTGMAMLAQANQSAKNVLQLLR